MLVPATHVACCRIVEEFRDKPASVLFLVGELLFLSRGMASLLMDCDPVELVRWDCSSVSRAQISV